VVTWRLRNRVMLNHTPKTAATADSHSSLEGSVESNTVYSSKIAFRHSVPCGASIKGLPAAPVSWLPYPAFVGAPPPWRCAPDCPVDRRSGRRVPSHRPAERSSDGVGSCAHRADNSAPLETPSRAGLTGRRASPDVSTAAESSPGRPHPRPPRCSRAQEIPPQGIARFIEPTQCSFAREFRGRSRPGSVRGSFIRRQVKLHVATLAFSLKTIEGVTLWLHGATRVADRIRHGGLGRASISLQTSALR
jgi:hypothetical protein